jgi:hypothetical protein
VHIVESLEVGIFFFCREQLFPVADQAVNFCSGIEPLVQNNLGFNFAALSVSSGGGAD